MKVIDLFSGVGGFSLGCESAGAKVISSLEKDTRIFSGHKSNFPESEHINEDIRDISVKDTFSKYKSLSKEMIIIGGPPCQGFSMKGKRLGLNDDRNFLFNRFVDVVKFLEPKWFVMENVPSLLTAENGYFLREIIDIFRVLDYNIDWGVLDASDYGVPQKRRRSFIIGSKSFPVKLTIKTEPKITVWDAISDLPEIESGLGSYEMEYTSPPLKKYQKMMRNKSEILTNHIATNHSSSAISRMKLVPVNGDRSSIPSHLHTKSIFSGTWARLKPDEQSRTITTRFDTPSSGMFTHPYQHRCITVREAARLQSFPDNFVFNGTKTIQMKQVGNAVPPLLAKKLVSSLMGVE